jgi:hypothetical protein
VVALVVVVSLVGCGSDGSAPDDVADQSEVEGQPATEPSIECSGDPAALRQAAEAFRTSSFMSGLNHASPATVDEVFRTLRGPDGSIRPARIGVVIELEDVEAEPTSRPPGLWTGYRAVVETADGNRITVPVPTGRAADAAGIAIVRQHYASDLSALEGACAAVLIDDRHPEGSAALDVDGGWPPWLGAVAESMDAPAVGFWPHVQRAITDQVSLRQLEERSLVFEQQYRELHPTGPS